MAHKTRNLAEALGAVPHDFRDVLVLVDIGQFSYADAAQILDIPIGTVMSRLHRGRRILKQELADLADLVDDDLDADDYDPPAEATTP